MRTADRAPSPVRERGVLLLVASGAGGAQREAVDAVIRELQGSGVDVREVACDDPRGLGTALDDRGERVPVSCGGDGSLHLLVQTLADRGELGTVPVGLVPLGTGNDFAGATGVPDGPAEAARVLLDGVVRTLDLAEADEGGLVVNATHLGAGALAAERGESLKPRVGPLAYTLGGVAAGVNPPEWQARVEVDGEVVHDGPVLVVAVGLGHRVGGGVPLLPEAVPDDALLDVVVASPDGLSARAAMGGALRAGEHLDREDVRSARGREVRVEVPADGPAMPLNVDGELLGEVRSRTWRVRPAAWGLLVPPDGTGPD